MDLRKYRLAANLTQQELADKIGVSKSLICQIENYKKLPSLPIFTHLLIALNICPCDILDIRDYIYCENCPKEF